MFPKFLELFLKHCTSKAGQRSADRAQSPPAHGSQAPAASCVPVCVLYAGPALGKGNSTCLSKKPQKCPLGLICCPHQP